MSACLNRYVACGGVPRWKMRPASTSRSRPVSSSSDGRSATADSRSNENSRPIAAPICAISFAGAEPVEAGHQRARARSRGRRVPARACGQVSCRRPRLRARSPAPTWSAPRRTAARRRSARRSPSTISSGRARLPSICLTSASPSRRCSRLSTSVVTCDWPVQGGWNSGRKVRSSSTGSAPDAVDGQVQQLA